MVCYCVLVAEFLPCQSSSMRADLTGIKACNEVQEHGMMPVVQAGDSLQAT